VSATSVRRRTLDLPEPLDERLRVAARQQGCSVSEILRIAVAAYLDAARAGIVRVRAREVESILRGGKVRP